MMSSPHGPYALGYTRVTMECTKSCEPAMVSESLKAFLSSDWSLQFDSMKLKSLVIAYQNDAVNTFPDLVHTARHTTEIVFTRRHLS